MADSLAITIISLAVNPNSWLALDPTVEQLFVEYQFLNYNETELETPVSLPKPRPGQSACFNFRQGTVQNRAGVFLSLRRHWKLVVFCSVPVFSLHPEHNAEARNELAAMLQSHDPDAGR